VKRKFSLKKNDEIKRVLDARHVVRNRYFSIHKYKNHDMNYFRFAISVPKKYGNAVERNQMKRRIKMIIAQYKIKEPFDFFIIVNPKAKQLSFQSIDQEITFLLKKHNIIEVK